MIGDSFTSAVVIGAHHVARDLLRPILIDTVVIRLTAVGFRSSHNG
jgi:hypothetical protein